MNNITVAGTLGRDAEIKHMANGDAIASFSVADSQGRDKPTIWWNCSLFGKRAESLAPYLLKGGSVTVSGNVSEREWTDKDGQKRKSMDIRVGDVALQGGKPAAAPAAPRPAAKQAPADFDDSGDSIPF
jgi:single-strand DNA-binding protein